MANTLRYTCSTRQAGPATLHDDGRSALMGLAAVLHLPGIQPFGKVDGRRPCGKLGLVRQPEPRAIAKPTKLPESLVSGQADRSGLRACLVRRTAEYTGSWTCLNKAFVFSIPVVAHARRSGKSATATGAGPVRRGSRPRSGRPDRPARHTLAPLRLLDHLHQGVSCRSLGRCTDSPVGQSNRVGGCVRCRGDR